MNRKILKIEIHLQMSFFIAHFFKHIKNSLFLVCPLMAYKSRGFFYNNQTFIKDDNK